MNSEIKARRFETSALGTEARTLQVMFRMYCKRNHGRKEGLCPLCDRTLDYALARLGQCRYGEDKPSCRRCPTHCYQVENAEMMRQVMRYAGPKMIWRAPLLALKHLFKEWIYQNNSNLKTYGKQVI